MKLPQKIQFIVLIAFLIVSCTSEVLPASESVSTNPPDAPTQPMNAETEALTAEASVMPTESSTAIPPAPDVTPMFIGTPISGSGQTISLGNLDRLAHVARWGRGTIQGIRFTPDGKSFVVGTALGLTVYDMNNLGSVPGWIPFASPSYFNAMYFSDDGEHLLLVSRDSNEMKKFSTGGSENLIGINWLRPQIGGAENYNEIITRSSDGTKAFRSNMGYEYNEDIFSEEFVTREMYDGKGNLLYTMSDDIPYVTYDDRVEPEGCDLGVFSPCGNALMSLAMAPGQVEFSPSGDTFTALYTVPSLWDSKKFSFLRVYDSSDGAFLMSLGGREHPISAFAYSSDSRSIGVAYLDGSVQIWNIGDKEARFGARHMNSQVGVIQYTRDSKYLLIQRGDELEIRQTSDGAMIGRFEAATFSISPVENLVAIGDRQGMVRVRRIDNGENVLVFQAHSDLVYSVAFSEDGLYLATGGRDCDVKMWDARTGQLLHYFEETRVDAYDIGANSRIFSYFMKFIPGTDMVIGFGSWGTAVAWDVDSGATRFVAQSAPLEYYNGMWTIKPHFPEYFWVEQSSNRFYINEIGYDLSTGAVVDKLEQEPAPEGCWPVGPHALDGSITITRGYDSREGKLCVLNSETRELVREISIAPSVSGYFVDWPYISPDGTQLLVTTTTGVIYLYQIIQ